MSEPGKITDVRTVGVPVSDQDRAIDFYDFEAKFVVWASASGHVPSPVTYGGQIKYDQNDVMLNPDLTYDWSTVKLVYFGPDDRRIVRTQLLGF